jgi:hypothetical protein
MASRTASNSNAAAPPREARIWRPREFRDSDLDTGRDVRRNGRQLDSNPVRFAAPRFAAYRPRPTSRSLRWLRNLSHP